MNYQAAERALVRLLKMHTDLTALEIREVAKHSHKVVDAALADTTTISWWDGSGEPLEGTE